MSPLAKPPRVGVLSLQGDFACHRGALEALGAEPVRVTLPRDLEGIAALVLPGGESTTMLRLLAATGLRAPVEAFVKSRPVMGTCAGVILLGHGGAHGSQGLPAPPLAVLDVAVERNAYGRQIDSFHEDLDVPVVGGRFPGVFIRAPRITRVGKGVEVIARRTSAEAKHEAVHAAKHETVQEAVGVRAGRVVGLCFHPELTGDLRLHRWFLTEVAGLDLPSSRGSERAPATAQGSGS